VHACIRLDDMRWQLARPHQKGKKYKDLTTAEAARLAGEIWIYGSIDIEYHKERPRYYYPRIMLTMPSPLPFDYKKGEDEKVWVEERDGKEYFTLEIGKQELVEKRLTEILPFMGGEERKQIEIALKIIMIKRLIRYKKKKERETQELAKLYTQWKECRDRLEKWVEDFKAKHQKVRCARGRVPTKIWNKAYLLEDC
jgi:hypothetical protein